MCLLLPASKTNVSGGGGVQVTWDNPDELEKYIAKLQAAADKLTSENRRLRKAHFIVQDKVADPSTCMFINVC